MRDRRVLYGSLLLVALLASAFVWGPGLVNTRGGGDSPFLLQRTHQLAANLRAGVFPARWMPDAAYGLGYPFFHYYAALPYYLAAGFTLLGGNILAAVKWTQTLGFVAAAFAMYGWTAGRTGRRGVAWLAAVAYTAAPFHLVNVYVRGDSLSEFYAFIFYPLVLWGLDRVAEEGRAGVRAAFPAALAYAGLALTHNLSFLIFSPFALGYVGVLAARARRGRVLALGLSSLVLGALLSAWFWLPALVELDAVQLGPSTQDFFHYSRHFRGLNLVQPTPLFDYGIAAEPRGRSPFAMGLAQAIFAVLGAIVLGIRAIRRRADRWDASFILGGLLLSTFMITPLSEFLWAHLPLLGVVQFPWRFLSVQALFGAAATAALVPRPPASRMTRYILPLGVAGLLLLATLLSLRPDRLPLGPGDVTRERLQLYELFTGNIGTTIRYEWLPRSATPRPFTSGFVVDPDAPARAIPLDGASLQATPLERTPTTRVWRVEGEGGRLALPLFTWPGWQAKVDGVLVGVGPVEGSGSLALTVPPGEHTVTLRLGHTPVRALAGALSLAPLLMMLIITLRRFPIVASLKRRDRGARKEKPENLPQIRSRARRRRLSSLERSERRIEIKTSRPSAGQNLVQNVCALCVLCALFVLPPLLLPAASPAGPLTMDFEQMPYLHPSPGGVPFEEGVRLLDYHLSAAEMAPTETLRVSFDWELPQGGPYTATLRLVSPAAVRYAVEPLAETSFSLPTAQPVTLVVRYPLPRGVYLLQLELHGPHGALHALTSTGRTRGTLALQPVRVVEGPPLAADAGVLAPFGPAVRLHAATVAQPAPDQLEVRLEWSAAQPLAVNYAISLRLLDAQGETRAALDTQPGYGFLPTGTWRPGERIVDGYTLPLPADLEAGPGYRVQVVLYPLPSLTPVGQAQIGAFRLPLDAPFEMERPARRFSPPTPEVPLGVTFDEQIRLAGVDLAREEDVLRLTLWWEALRAPAADYTVFVHLFDPEERENVVQSDAYPRAGAYPTSWWAAGEVVSETIALPLAGLEPGTYRLAAGLYDHTLTRLPATGPGGERIPDDRPVLPVEMEVEP